MNVTTKVLTCVLFLVAGGTAHADLLTYLPFDETSGTTAFDASGNSVDANVSGSIEWVAGKSGNAVHFESGSSEQVSWGPTEVTSSLTLGTGDFTFAFWFKGGLNAAAERRLVNYNAFVSNNSPALLIMTANQGGGVQHLRISMGSFFTDAISGQTTDLASTTDWFHIALTRSGTTVTAYINGIQEGVSGTSSVSLGSTGGNGLYLGRYLSGGNPDPYTGEMDDFAIWNQALTGTQIATLANSTATPLTAVPEPASLALISIGSLMMLRRRKA